MPTVGSPTTPASCADLCARLRKICGYAPLECTTADGGGYCAEQFDTSHRVCVGQAASCKDALACANDDAASDAGADSGAGDATGNDAAADAATDAKGQ